MNGAEIIEAYRNQSERSLEEMIDTSTAWKPRFCHSSGQLADQGK